MSDWKKRNDDWRDEDELEEEEECECPWVDSKGKVRETAYCQYLLEKHPMMCLKQKLFDQNGEVDEDALLYEVHSDLRDFVLDNLAKKEKQVLDALRIETYTPCLLYTSSHRGRHLPSSIFCTIPPLFPCAVLRIREKGLDFGCAVC